MARLSRGEQDYSGPDEDDEKRDQKVERAVRVGHQHETDDDDERTQCREYDASRGYECEYIVTVMDRYQFASRSTAFVQ